MSDPKPLLFALYEQASVGCDGAPSLWTHPADERLAINSLGYWSNLARIADQAHLDMLFFGDVLGFYDVFGGNADAAMKWAVEAPANDPLMIIPALAAVTENLAFGVTVTTSYEHPFIAGTKTLSKLANHAAKKWQAQSGGVVDLRDQTKRDWVLKKCSVSDVWGVGRKMTLHLEGMGIKSAWDLSKTDPWTLRKKFSVVIEKTARELAGTPCLELDEPDPPKQEICCSRMFGKRLTEIAPIKEAVASPSPPLCW